jgi:hypothetical protein
MRKIRGLALGTYYAIGASGGASSPHASEMRGLVYAVKNNRLRPNPPQVIAHSRHPAAARGVWVDRNNAVDYVAAIVAKHLGKICARLQLDPNDAVLVPIPSSTVVRSTIDTDRWPALKLARAFEAVGLGRCRIAAVNRTPMPSKTSGAARRTTSGILANLEAVERLTKRSSIVLVDDVVTRGRRVAALDIALGRPAAICVIVVGITDADAVPDCYRPRLFEVRYVESHDEIVPDLVRR